MPLPKKKKLIKIDYLRLKYLFFGRPKVGKTTIAANFGSDKDKILFFATEPGHDMQSIYAWHVGYKEIPFDHPDIDFVLQKEGDPIIIYKGPHDLVDIDHDKKECIIGLRPSKFKHFETCVREMIGNEEGYRCLCIDTIDNLWLMASAVYCSEKGIKDIGDLNDFGASYRNVKSMISDLISELTMAGYGIVLLSHEKTTEEQRGPRTVSVTDNTIGNSLKKYVNGLVDFIFYFGEDEESNRYILTKGNESYILGDRSGLLPERMPLDAEVLKKEIKKSLLTKYNESLNGR